MAAARFAAVFGQSLLPTALAFGVLGLPGGSPATLGLVMAAAAFGQVALVIPGGVLADRWPRKMLMVLAEIVSGSTLILLGVLYISGQATVIWMAVLAGISGMASGIFYPAATGFVPEMSPPASLQTTNSVLRMAANIARISGTAVSGIMVAFLGSGWAIAASGFLALLAAMFVSRLKPRYPATKAAGRGPFSELREGWREFSKRSWVVAIVVAGGMSSFGVSAYFGVLGPLRMDESGGPTQWALISASLATGTLAGVVIAIRIRPHRPLLVAVIALGLLSLPIAALALPTGLYVAMAAAFIAGVALDIFSVLWETTLQRNVPAHVLSRVSSFDWLLSFALAPVALIVAGPLVLSFGLSAVLWAAAALAISAPLAVLVPQVRRLTSTQSSAG